MPGQTGPKVASCVCVLWECASLGSKQEQKDPWQGEPTLLGGGGWNGLRTPVKMWALHLRTEGKLNTHLEGRRAIDCLSFFLSFFGCNFIKLLDPLKNETCSLGCSCRTNTLES